MNVQLEDITIRNTLRPGDLGYVVYLHGLLYGKEYGYGITFEMYVALGLHEFYARYDPAKDRVWLCEHEKKIIGFLLLMDRGDDCAQLRYFLVSPEYRGVGLGAHLMQLFMRCLVERNFHSAYLWTTHELGTAAALYERHGFELSEEKPSTTFGKPLREQRYDLVVERSDRVP